MKLLVDNNFKKSSIQVSKSLIIIYRDALRRLIWCKRTVSKNIPLLLFWPIPMGNFHSRHKNCFTIYFYSYSYLGIPIYIILAKLPGFCRE